MKQLRTLHLIALVAILAIGTAFAATHDPDADRYVGAGDQGPAKAVLPVKTVEAITYEVMPQVHRRVEENTGRSVTYSYVIVTVGGEQMAVDPFRFNR
ncbi:MAG: hypothetical protein P1P87_02415 [Trueperaceae bacterium]|nr:hypothetical protein [Trueperaceae bacterium]